MLTIKKRRVLGAAVITLSMLTAGCVQPYAPQPQPSAIYVQSPPPADVYEVQPPPPDGSPYWVWQKGHWLWNGHRYVWKRGHWVSRPPRYSSWVAPHWVPRGGNWVFVEGHWQ